MAALLWKVNLPAGLVSAVSDSGTYLVQAHATRRYWTVSFTAFPTADAGRALPACPAARFPSWDAACAACARHADAAAKPPVLMRA